MRKVYIDNIDDDKTIFLDDDDSELINIDWKHKAVFLPQGLSFEELINLSNYINERKDKLKVIRDYE